MPFVSRAQRRFMYSKDPKMAHKFEQKTPKDKQLPERVRPRKIGIRKSMGRQTRLSEFDPDWEDPDYGPVTEYHATANLPAVRREGIVPPRRMRSRRFYPEEMRESPPERATFTTTDLDQARSFAGRRGHDPSRSGIVGVRTRGMAEPAFQMEGDMPTHVREGGVAPQRLVMVKSLLRKTPVRYLIRKTTDRNQLSPIDLGSQYTIAELQDIANFHQAMQDHNATPQIDTTNALSPNVPFGSHHPYAQGYHRGLFTSGGESRRLQIPHGVGQEQLWNKPVFEKPEEFIHTVAQMYMSGNTRQHPEGHVLSIPLGDFSHGSITSKDGRYISGLSAITHINPDKSFYVKSIVPIGSKKLPTGQYGPITHLRTKKNSSKHEKLVTEHGDAHVGDLGEFGGVDSETHSNYFSTMSRPEEEPTQEPKKIIRVKEDFNIHPELENLGFGVKNKKKRKLDFSNVKHEYGDYRKTNWGSHPLIPNALQAIAGLQNTGEISEEDAFPYYEAIFNFWKGKGYADADEIFKPYYLNKLGIDPENSAIKRVMDAHKDKMGIKKSRFIRIVKGRNVSKLLVRKPSRRIKKFLRVVS